MNKKLKNWIISILILVALLVGVTIFSLSIGSAGILFRKIIPLILSGDKTIDYTILFELRLPRIIMALVVGGALSIAGVIFQGMFRNPLVEPYTLGVSGGAAVGVSLSIIFGIDIIGGLNIRPLFGFMGAILSILLVYIICSRQGSLRVSTLLLTGVMISFISSALIMLILSLSREEKLHGILFWIMGSLGQTNWGLIKTTFLFTILGMVVSLFFSLDLNALSLGEEEAIHLGINIERTKRLLFILASLLTGCAVSVSGIIGFVGLIVPHFVRMFMGSDHRILLVDSALCGGIFLLLCDTLARIIIVPLELPVGVITGIIGGLIFVYFLGKKQLMLGGR